MNPSISLHKHQLGIRIETIDAAGRDCFIVGKQAARAMATLAIGSVKKQARPHNDTNQYF